MIASLQRHGLAAPLLLVVDGNARLKKALECWDGARLQREPNQSGPIHDRDVDPTAVQPGPKILSVACSEGTETTEPEIVDSGLRTDTDPA